MAWALRVAPPPLLKFILPCVFFPNKGPFYLYGGLFHLWGPFFSLSFYPFLGLPLIETSGSAHGGGGGGRRGGDKSNHGVNMVN